HLANAKQRILGSVLGSDPALFGIDDVQQQLFIRRIRQPAVELLVIFLLLYRLTCLRVIQLLCPFADVAIELDIRTVELGIPWLSAAADSLYQLRALISVQIAIVVIEIVEIGLNLVLRLVVATLDSPNIGPVCRGRMIGAKEVVGAGDPFVEILLQQPSRNY